MQFFAVCGRVGVGWLITLALAVAELDGQMLYGRVLDAQSGQGVSQALVEVLQDGSTIARSVADDTGGYRISLPASLSGSYWLRVSRLGFATQDSPPLQVGPTDIVEVHLRISPSPLPIAELMVEVRRSNLRHEATHEGLYARRAQARAVGQERVVVVGDPELQHASRVHDVMNLLFFGTTSARTRCTDYYVDGIRRDASVLQIPADMVEGVEYYVDGRFAPFGFVGGRCAAAFRYSVVAVWLRRP